MRKKQTRRVDEKEKATFEKTKKKHDLNMCDVDER